MHAFSVHSSTHSEKCVYLCNPHCNQDTAHFQSLQKVSSHLFPIRPPPTQAIAVTNSVTVMLALPALEFHINENLHYVLFSVWLLLLNTTFLRFIAIVACISSFLFIAA